MAASTKDYQSRGVQRTTTSINFDDDILAALRRAAADDHRTMSAYVNNALRQWLISERYLDPPRIAVDNR